MRAHIGPALAVLLVVGGAGAGVGGETNAGPSGRMDRPSPEEARAACNTIAAILSIYPTLEVRTSEGSAPERQDDSERPGCRVLAAGPASGLAGEVQPDEALRELMRQAGWEEDLRHSADGPGATSFALRKDGVVCFVGGGAHSWIEDGKTVTAATYELEARCAALRQ